MTKRRTISISRFIPPNICGPEVTIAISDIVGIEQEEHDNMLQKWRALIHLRGGGTILTDVWYEDMIKWVYHT